jgi:hypothetical protein
MLLFHLDAAAAAQLLLAFFTVVTVLVNWFVLARS